jgi:hypothetical protein
MLCYSICSVAALCRLLCLLLCAQGLCNIITTSCRLQCITRPRTHRNRHTDVLQHVVLLGCSVAGSPCRLLCSLHAQVCASCQAARQVQPGLFDRLDTSQQIHRCLLICLASRVGHAGRMLLSSAICRLLCLLLCAQGLCNMSLQPGRYSLVSLTDLTHPNRCTDVYWYALNLVQVTGPCSCLLLSAGCCAVAACTGFVQHVNQAVTGCKVCFTDPTHQNNR